MLKTENEVTTVFIGNYFEWTGTITDPVKYYYAGPQRVAMRKGDAAPLFLLGDHLGSTNVVYDPDEGEIFSPGGGRLYLPWGDTWVEPDGELVTKYRYTGQYAEFEDANNELYNYGARFYDSALGRFLSPDTLIPDPYNPLDWDRYSYVRNNPLKFTDPSGHMPCNEQRGCDGQSWEPPSRTTPKPKEEAQTRQPWSRTFNLTYGYHVGWSVVNAPDQSNDDFLNPTDAAACSASNKMAALCAFVVLARFALAGPQNTDTNFWINLTVNYSETGGITISNITMANYSGVTLNVTDIRITSGNQAISISNGPIDITSGFGGDHSITTPITFNGNNDITITLAYLQLVNLGSSARPGITRWYPKIRATLPPLQPVMSYDTTGQYPIPTFPIIP